MKWLTSYAWVDDENGLHFAIDEMLREADVPNTPENRALCIQVVQEECAELLPNVPQIVTARTR